MRNKREVLSKTLHIRFRPKEITQLKKTVEEKGYLSVSELIRFSIKNFLEGGKDVK